MPLITEKARVMGDGTKLTTYTDSVGPSYVTYTMEKEQESFTLYNKGLKPIVYTVGASVDVTVNPGEKSTVATNFTSFQVKSTAGVQQFLVETDESGDDFEDVKVKKLSDKIGVLSGVSENKLSYTYFPNGDVQTITEKDKNNVVISTTTFVYKTNGDVDTSTLAKDGVTITTQYIYDANGNLTDTVNTKA